MAFYPTKTCLHVSLKARLLCTYCFTPANTQCAMHDTCTMRRLRSLFVGWCARCPRRHVSNTPCVSEIAIFYEQHGPNGTVKGFKQATASLRQGYRTQNTSCCIL